MIGVRASSVYSAATTATGATRPDRLTNAFLPQIFRPLQYFVHSLPRIHAGVSIPNAIDCLISSDGVLSQVDFSVSFGNDPARAKKMQVSWTQGTAEELTLKNEISR